jgi:hypothetical protein
MNQHIRRIIVAVFALGCLLTIGCGPRMMQAATTPRPTEAPAVETARVYFIAPTPRVPYQTGSAIIVDGDTLLGQITNRQVFYSDLPAGNHTLMALAQNTGGIAAALEGGKTYYVKLTFPPGFTSNSVVFIPITPGTAEWDTRIAWLDTCTLIQYVPEGGAAWDAKNKARNAKRAVAFESGEARALPMAATDGE